MIIIPTNHWVPLLSPSMAFLAFPFLKLSRPQLEIKEAKSIMDWNLCDNSGNQGGNTLYPSLTRMSKKEALEQDWQTLGGNGGFSFRKFLKHFLNHWVINGVCIDGIKEGVKEDTKVLRGLLKLPGWGDLSYHLGIWFTLRAGLVKAVVFLFYFHSRLFNLHYPDNLFQLFACTSSSWVDLKKKKKKKTSHLIDV